MNSIPEILKREGGRSGSGRLGLVAASLILAVLSGHAAISEPDAVVYGSIVIGNTPITAARTDVVVEARRTAGGPAVAACRMGAEPAYGDLYVLRLRLQSVLPLADPEAFRVGETVLLTAADLSGGTAQGSFVISDRGEARRVNLGQAAGDTDQDGLPDAWELAQFENLNRGAGSLCPNGQTARANFIAGTNPNAAGSGFSLEVASNGDAERVSFTALRAQGTGYEGRQRFYALEWSSDPLGPFTGVPGFGNIAGNNQAVTFDAPHTGAGTFFRGRVWLQ